MYIFNSPNVPDTNPNSLQIENGLFDYWIQLYEIGIPKLSLICLFWNEKHWIFEVGNIQIWTINELEKFKDVKLAQFSQVHLELGSVNFDFLVSLWNGTLICTF